MAKPTKFVPFWQRKANPVAQMGIGLWPGEVSIPSTQYSPPPTGYGTDELPYYLPTIAKPGPASNLPGGFAAASATTTAHLGATGGAPPGVSPYVMMQWAAQQIAKYKKTKQWMQEVQDYAGPQLEAPPEGGAGGGGWTSQYAPAPTGIDPTWYQQFQAEHEGMTPEQFYAQTGEDIGSALADQEWAEQWAAEHGGVPPDEYQWRYHWFMTRYGHPPPENYDQWLEEQQAGYGGTKEDEQNPPTYQPPMIIWS